MRLELDRVTAGYGGSVAVRDVSLVVPEGHAVALLGPNGAGKTTLLNAASGLVPVRSGRVLIDRRDVSQDRLAPRARSGLCHVTEGRAVFPGLDVRDNLRMFSARGREKESIERAIDAFPRLGERMSQIAGTMSGGEQQMLALARAYARRAPLVLLDEVSMGLAPIIIDEIFDFLARLKREGAGLLIVEQYAAKALSLADFVYVLVRGRIVLAGEPEEIAKSDVFTHYLGGDMAVA
jgi:branched-chain amino acid transport system ATP-binding protein